MFTRGAYNPTDGISNTTSFPDSPGSSAAFRAQFQTLYDQMMAALNALATELEDTTTGSSGSENIGSAAISGVEVSEGVSAVTVRQQLVAIKAIADAAVSGSLTPGVINNANLFGSGVVPQSAMADNSVDSAQYVDGSIDPEHLAPNAVTADAIASGAVTAAKLASDAVETAKIKDLNVTEGKIATGAVTKTKLGTRALAWTKIVTDRAIGSTSGSETISSLAGYSEILIQIKDQSGTSLGNVIGFYQAPLQSSGAGDPVLGEIVQLASNTVYSRTLEINETSIAWGSTTHPDASVLKMCVFVR